MFYVVIWPRGTHTAAISVTDDDRTLNHPALGSRRVHTTRICGKQRSLPELSLCQGRCMRGDDMSKWGFADHPSASPSDVAS